MLYNGDLTSNRTDELIEEYVKLLNSGIKSSKILVLVQNSRKKEYFTEQVLQKLKIDYIEKLEIHSFFALVYNTVLNNWAEIENSIPDKTNTHIIPTLSGLELSQYIMRQIISKVSFKGYNSKKSLLHQLFRRYSLIVQNNLSPDEVQWRCERVLGESFYEDAKSALDIFKKETLNYRALDYLRQTLIFNYIYKNTDYFKNIEYLFLDDGDEITPVCYDFIKFLKPQIKQAFIAYDKKGSTRIGYLSANKKYVSEFDDLFEDNIMYLKSNSKLANDAEKLLNNVLENKCEKLENIVYTSFLTREQMTRLEELKKLLKSGVKPSDIVIVSPVCDNILKFCINNNLYGLFNPVFVSGNEKLVQNKLIAFCLNIIKQDKNDLRKIFDYLDIPIKYLNLKWNIKEYSEKYQKYLDVLEKIKNETLLSRKIMLIYNELVTTNDYNDLVKFNFLIKKVEEFESLNIEESEIINQLENSIISENPVENMKFSENDLIIATPQKVIDNKIISKYQFWLDVSSNEWVKSDTGPLYNSWVMQKNWNKDKYSIQDNIELSNQKTARLLRKLSLCATEKIYAYSSLYDSTGVENFGGIEKYLSVNKTEKEISTKTFTPREDQKPILEYNKGKMAISAVPGAGKTTILLELIIKILKSGVNPEHIFVMTYMESAARNFRERIKLAAPDLVNLPNISTIHGLALRILKENNNFERLNLNYDFEICDDSKKSQILSGLAKNLKITPKEAEQFEKAVSIVKMAKIKEFPEITDKKIQKFILFFKEYERILKENNLIDYDDMLISSVKLLKENDDILEHYKNICEYLIEDEAQDSSAIQQELITLLSSKHKNLIRCGDVNQAITTTFSNADVQGFKTFIKKSPITVSMDCSQRCTEDVWKLANKLVKTYKNDFFEIYMKPVENKNPKEKNAILTNYFSNEAEERGFVFKQIKNLLKQNPNATIGILLRNNFQVNRWTNFIEQSGLKTIVRNESLSQKGFFRTIFSVLKFISNPFDNEILADCYMTLSGFGFYKSGYYDTIKNFEKSFIQADLDELPNTDLSIFLWDMIYWLNFPNLSFDELIIKIGLYYYNSEIDKSNIYILSAFVKRLNMSDISALVSKLYDLSLKSSISGIKFFSEEENNNMVEGKVQVMTMHKAKGDEFDYVFMPEMTEKSLPLSLNTISLRKDARFIETLKEFSSEYNPKTDEELKHFILEENLRLMYVAITRAKRKLFISVSKNTKQKNEPNKIFNIIEEQK